MPRTLGGLKGKGMGSNNWLGKGQFGDFIR